MIDTKGCIHGCKKGKIFMPVYGTFIDCPIHSAKNVDLDTIEINEDVSLADALMIPEQYRSLGVVDRALFNTDISDIYSTTSIRQMSALLEKINQNLYNGSVPKISCYIHCPPKLDIKHFIYASQKLALEKGLSVVPYISANTLYGIQSLGDVNLKTLHEVESLLRLKKTGITEIYELIDEDGNISHTETEYKNLKGVQLGKEILELLDYHEGMRRRELLDKANKRLSVFSSDVVHAVDGYRFLNETGLTYGDYIKSDLCYINVTANTRSSGVSAIADLIAERSMRNLPTFVFGYWASNRGKTKDYLKYILSDGTNNRLDLLEPFDLKSKGSKEAVEIGHNLDRIVGTRSNISSGYSIFK